jgi:Haem-binding domain
MGARSERRLQWRGVGWAALMGMAAVFLAIQIVPTERTNPPSEADVAAPPPVEAIIRRACYDCHSNETRWPWYSRVAPISWLVVHDVELGRAEMNFSEWGTYYPPTRRRKLKWMERALREEKMPLRTYRLMHPEARISEADRTVLEEWAQQSLRELENGKN